MKKPASAPPELHGFDYVQWLGGGGFADVFLFRQRRPNREVAVKVLRQSVFDASIQGQFEAEADLMAAVSEHPYIVSIYSADIAPDGRPYLTMEYYPKGHYLDRARQRGVTVQEALRVGIQIASAVETAHEAGIYHNDIKPSNVLMSGFDRPGLTDFGISVVVADGASGGARGASLPYTAPEIIEEELSGSRTADVFSLGATLYTLLGGHSPFERTNASNDAASVLDRVLHVDPPPLRRDGVPAGLEHLLRQSLSRRAGERPPTARAFAVSLQSIEQELGLQMTQLELRTANTQQWSSPDTSDVDSTRYRAPVVVRPHEDMHRMAPSGSPPAPAPIAPIPPGMNGGQTVLPLFDTGGPPARPDDQTRLRGGWSAPTADATSHRQPSVLGAGAPPAVGKTAPTRRVVQVAMAAVAAVIIAGAAIVLRNGSPDEPTVAAKGTVLAPAVSLGPPLLTPTELTVRFVSDGVVEATWKPPAGAAVTDYQVRRTDAAANGETITVVEPTVTFTGLKPNETPCLEISSRRGSKISQSATPSVCATR